MHVYVYACVRELLHAHVYVNAYAFLCILSTRFVYILVLVMELRFKFAPIFYVSIPMGHFKDNL